MIKGPKFESYDGGSTYVPDKSVFDLTLPCEEVPVTQVQGQEGVPQPSPDHRGISPDELAQSQQQARHMLDEVERLFLNKGGKNNG